MLVAVLALCTFGWSAETVPGQVTTLRVAAVTDTSLVLNWNEVNSGGTAIARYAVRFGSPPLVWPQQADVVTGGCAAPVYGSTAAGGRTRSCVLGGLQPNHFYAVQLISYTGVLNSNAVFGSLSNIVEVATAERIGPLLVSRPRMFLDTVRAVHSADFGALGVWRWPVDIGLFVGDYSVTFRNAQDSAVAHGYVLVVKP